MPQENSFALSKIMLPVDMRHREDAARASSAAAALAEKFGATLYVMTAERPIGDDITEYPEHHKPDFEKFVVAIGADYSIAAEALFRHHESADKMILDTAKEINADLIVMATHDPKLTDHLFGSHASHVALHAPCSVMVVR